MSSVEAPSGPRTIQVPGNGTAQLSFTLPPGITLDVESVLVNVDTTGSGATTAELQIAEQSGVVIATKRQSETIDPLLFGSATWALRLADNGGGAVTAGYDQVLDEGLPLPQRQILDFEGAGVTATDFPAFGYTIVTIPGAGAPTRVAPRALEVQLAGSGGASGITQTIDFSTDVVAVFTNDRTGAFQNVTTAAAWVGSAFTVGAVGAVRRFALNPVGGFIVSVLLTYNFSLAPTAGVTSTSLNVDIPTTGTDLLMPGSDSFLYVNYQDPVFAGGGSFALSAWGGIVRAPGTVAVGPTLRWTQTSGRTVNSWNATVTFTRWNDYN